MTNFVDVNKVLESTSLNQLPTVAFGLTGIRLYVRTSWHSYRVDFVGCVSGIVICSVYHYRGRSVVNEYAAMSYRDVFERFKTMFK